jgi:hypothetical protein
MTYKMSEHMTNSDWKMKPNNIYMINEDIQCSCPGEILLQQQDSQSLKHPTIKQNDWQPYWNVFSDTVRKHSEYFNPQTSHSKQKDHTRLL